MFTNLAITSDDSSECLQWLKLALDTEDEQLMNRLIPCISVSCEMWGAVYYIENSSDYQFRLENVGEGHQQICLLILKTLEAIEASFLKAPSLKSPLLVPPYEDPECIHASIYGIRGFLLHQLGLSQQGVHWAKICMVTFSEKTGVFPTVLLYPLSLGLALQVADIQNSM